MVADHVDSRADYLVPRYGSVPAAAPHYESMYLTATHPSDGTAVWIRYTVGKPPGSPASASVWFTYFGADGVRASKQTVDEVRSTPEQPLVVGSIGSIDSSGARASLAEVSWELTFADQAEPMSHLKRPWMYRSPIPRTKPTSPAPDMTVSGTITLDGQVITLDAWRGMLGHNWGSEHALRWIWLRGASFAESPATWLDVVIGRIRVGPVTSPWIANGMLCLDGVRHRVGGAYRWPSISERDDGCEIGLAAPGIRLTANVTATRERSVGWRYADPGGADHQVRNCSAAGMRLQVTARGHGARDLQTSHGAVYELGTHEFDPALQMQPFADR